MVTDTGIIVTSIVSLAGMLLFFILSNNNWFKRENFKIQKSNILAENRIKMKKLEKELGLKKGAKEPKIDDSGGLFDLLKGLDTKKISGVLEMLQGDDGEYSLPEDNSAGMIGNFISENPELVKSFLDGVGQNKQETTNNTTLDFE